MQANTKADSKQNIYDIMQRAANEARQEGDYKVIGRSDLLRIITQVSEASSYPTRKAYLDTLDYMGFVVRRDKHAYYVMEANWYASKWYAEHQTEIIVVDAPAAELTER